MRILSVILLVLVFLSARTAQAQDATCADKKPAETDIEFNITVADPYYDLTLDKAAVNKNGQKTVAAWLAKNNMQGIWAANDMTTEGYASGAWGAYYAMSLEAVPYDVYGAVFCPYFKKVEIGLMFRTLIAIPKEYTDEPCTFKAINDHELRHYFANKEALDAYVVRLKHDMPAIIAQIESEPVGRGEVKDRFNVMKQAIADAVNVYFNQAMVEKASSLNALIDTPQEYTIRSIMIHNCRGT